MPEEYKKHYKEVYSLKNGSNTIGRVDSCDIVIPSPVSYLVFFSPFLALIRNILFKIEFIKSSCNY